MLFDDYVMRQIQQIAQLVAAVAGRAAGEPYEGIEAQLDDAYRSLLGMERTLAERMAAESLARLLGDPDAIRALALLMRAHGDLCASRGEVDAAARLFDKALALLVHAEDDALEDELRERLAATR